MYILYAVIAFSLLIIVHELGHFILAKLNGVKVHEFALGMGPKLFGFKIGETDYNLRMLPIGGYVGMLGETEESDDPRSLNKKKPLQRFCVMIAGVAMNYILAISLFAILAYNFGFSKSIVKDVRDNSPAKEAGIKAGDEILGVNSHKVYVANDLAYEILRTKGKPIEIEYKSGDQIFKKTVTPKMMKIPEQGKDDDSKKEDKESLIVGVNYEWLNNPSVFESIKYASNENLSFIKETYLGLKNLITGKGNLKTDVGGPVTIIKMTGAAAKAGVWNLMWLTAFISIQLAVLNLLPFPPLDGGKILFVLIELISGKKVPNKIAEYVEFIGLMILFGLMILVTLKDVLFPIKI
ncbi:site-2 protease. Metallo peptidase. MEROPS family M50B [Clostridium cavendishii DSM 21758]|uniref:Zinc metalloprotease n=1 Tax=Clostridium cavendishii DSM 21758 TaxID=1121302 RepID=A0A1M6RLE3_9CLOT|nr:RIP metalloprotease RseP [Clostridium cavendishii]SHK33275.1 site-2 protease. Metallo peptidase. MEROPS family M50B [Clostridium cavendishii DSM 21758]